MMPKPKHTVGTAKQVTLSKNNVIKLLENCIFRLYGYPRDVPQQASYHGGLPEVHVLVLKRTTWSV